MTSQRSDIGMVAVMQSARSIIIAIASSPGQLVRFGLAHVGISLLITKASPSEIGTVSAATMADAVRSDLRYGDTGT